MNSVEILRLNYRVLFLDILKYHFNFIYIVAEGILFFCASSLIYDVFTH